MPMPPAITDVVLNDERLGFHLEDGRFISVPVAFYPTLALATPEERGRLKSTDRLFIGRSWMPTLEWRACSPGRGTSLLRAQSG